MEAQEYLIYTKRLQEEYERMLSYRKMIASEIELQTKVLDKLKQQNEEITAEYCREIEKQKDKLQKIERETLRYKDGLIAKGKELDDKEEAIAKENAKIKKQQEDLAHRAILIDDEKKEIDSLKQGILLKQEQLSRELSRASQLTDTAKNKEQKATMKELVAQKNFDEAKRKLNDALIFEKELFEREARLSIERNEIGKLAAAVEKDRIKLYSQQQSLRNAITETQRKWQISMPK